MSIDAKMPSMPNQPSPSTNLDALLFDMYKKFHNINSLVFSESDVMEIIKDFILGSIGTGDMDIVHQEIDNGLDSLASMTDIKQHKTIDIIKYIIKGQTTMGKKFWKEVLEKISNEFYDKSTSGKLLPEEKKMLKNERLVILENYFLKMVTEEYMKKKIIKAKANKEQPIQN